VLSVAYLLVAMVHHDLHHHRQADDHVTA